MLLRGNQEVLVYIIVKDLYKFKEREDIKGLCQEFLKISNTKERWKIISDIKVLLDRFIKLYLTKRYQDWFKTLDNLSI